LIKIQSLIRGRLVRKKYINKSTYRTKETETNRYNFKDTNSDIHSINIGSDIVNGAGLLSNGAYINRNNDQRQILNFKNALKSDEKAKIDLQNIVRKKIIFI
jgi:hypothetical protein